MSAATPPTLRNNTHLDVVIPIPSAGPQPGTALSALTRIEDEDDDDELSDETIARLLREAEERMKNDASGTSSALSKTNTVHSLTSIKCVHYQPLFFPLPYTCQPSFFGQCDGKECCKCVDWHR